MFVFVCHNQVLLQLLAGIQILRHLCMLLQWSLLDFGSQYSCGHRCIYIISSYPKVARLAKPTSSSWKLDHAHPELSNRHVYQRVSRKEFSTVLHARWRAGENPGSPYGNRTVWPYLLLQYDGRDMWLCHTVWLIQYHTTCGHLPSALGRLHSCRALHVALAFKRKLRPCEFHALEWLKATTSGISMEGTSPSTILLLWWSPVPSLAIAHPQNLPENWI